MLIGWLQARFNDPLKETQPEIEFIRWTESHSLIAFAGRHSIRAAGKLAGMGGKICIRTTDGEVFQRYGSEQKWKGPEKYGSEGFHSKYLDDWLSHALDNGLEKQRSAYDISSALMSPHGMRMWTIWNGSDEEFAKIDENYPSPPTSFSTGHDGVAPEDYEETNPYFAAYLVKQNWHPWRPELNGHGSKAGVKSNPAPDQIVSASSKSSPRRLFY